MARRTPRPTAPFATTLTPLRETCEACGTRWWVAYHRRRKIMTLEGLWQLTVIIGQCPNPTCPLYHVRYHPEEEGRWALPHGEFGLDVIAAIGAWRFAEHRSVPEMHQRLQARGLSISERAVTHLLHRYEELVTLRVTDQERLQARLKPQGRVILAIDGGSSHAMRNELSLSHEVALERASMNAGWQQGKGSLGVSGQRVLALLIHAEGKDRAFKNCSACHFLLSRAAGQHSGNTSDGDAQLRWAPPRVLGEPGRPTPTVM